jgi:hypothetical protein
MNNERRIFKFYSKTSSLVNANVRGIFLDIMENAAVIGGVTLFYLLFHKVVGSLSKGSVVYQGLSDVGKFKWQNKFVSTFSSILSFGIAIKVIYDTNGQ